MAARRHRLPQSVVPRNRGDDVSFPPGTVGDRNGSNRHHRASASGICICHLEPRAAFAISFRRTQQADEFLKKPRPYL